MPVVLDSSFRTPSESKVLLNAQAGRGKRPIIIGTNGFRPDQAMRLAGAGARLEVVSSAWPDTLRVLQKRGLHSVMVEGGAQVISSLLWAAQGGVVIDHVIITIGKTMLGSSGVGYAVPEGMWSRFELVATEEFGEDTVVVFRPRTTDQDQQ